MSATIFLIVQQGQNHTKGQNLNAKCTQSICFNRVMQEAGKRQKTNHPNKGNYWSWLCLGKKPEQRFEERVKVMYKSGVNAVHGFNCCSPIPSLLIRYLSHLSMRVCVRVYAVEESIRLFWYLSRIEMCVVCEGVHAYVDSRLYVALSDCVCFMCMCTHRSVRTRFCTTRKNVGRLYQLRFILLMAKPCRLQPAG